METDRNRIAQECFRKGTEAMAKENWDYCIDMFGKASALVPDNLMFRQTKHGAIRKKYGDNGSGARMAKMKLMTVRGKIKKAKMKKDWPGVDKLAEEGLLVNPWDSQLFSDLGESALEREFEEIAVYGFGNAVKNSPENIGFNRQLGSLLRDRKEFDAARTCFQKIYKLDPNDREARTILGQIDAERMLDGSRGGYDNVDNSETQKVKPKDAYEADRQARKGRKPAIDGPGQSEEADLQHAIRKDPKDVNGYLRLADFYRSKKKLKLAADQFEKALEVSDGDSDVREQLEDVQIDEMRNNSAEAREEARKDPENEKKKEKSQKLMKELVLREIEVLAARVERYPQDLKLKYELAQRYKRVGKFTKAIPLFQQSGADQRIKEDVLVGLGECFLKEKKSDLARRQFEKATATLNAMDKPDLFKVAHYWLGRIYEKNGKTDQSEHHYTEILAVDYEYKDVLARLEGLQSDE